MKTANRPLWTGKTARQEIIEFATVRFSLNRQHGWTVGEAIEDCIDGWEALNRGTIRHEMGRYVAGLSDTGYARLCSTIMRAAR
jgi:hypothetical protein